MKRTYVTFFVISVMTLGLLFLLLTRGRLAYDAPAEEIVPVAVVADAGIGEGGLASAADGGVSALVDGGADAGVRARPVRVAALGWDLAAPGLALLLRSGAEPVAPSLPALEVTAEEDVDGVAGHLARGGDDPLGADVAVLPVASFVVAYEKLRALDPRAVAVVGFSRGREELRAAPGALARAAASTEDARLVAVGNDTATTLGLFVLRASGVAPSRVRFVAPGTADARTAVFSALSRGAESERKLVVSTVEASRLAPFVLVAPRTVLEQREPMLRDLVRVWLESAAKVAKDPAPLARATVGRADAGAVDALALLDRLGRLETSALADQGALVLGTQPGSLASALATTWSLAREGGLTSSATPDPLPIDPRVVKALGAVAPPLPEPVDVSGDAGAPAFGSAPPGATTLFVMRDPGAPTTPPKGSKPLGPTELAALASSGTTASELTSVAAFFPRATLRVSSPLGEKAARAFATAAVAAGVPASRVVVGAAPPPGPAVVAVELLAAP